MAVLVRYSPSSLTREQYDRINETMRQQGSAEPPQELRIHVLFGDESNMRVSEIWESEAAWHENWPTLKEALSGAGVELGDPEIIQVHELWGSGLNPS